MFICIALWILWKIYHSEVKSEAGPLSLWSKLYFKDGTLSSEHSAINCVSQQLGILRSRVTVGFFPLRFVVRYFWLYHL